MFWLAILSAVLLAFQSASATAEKIDWRPISCQARVSLLHHDFSEAESGYKKAISILESEDGGAEIIPDLELALVEVYRQQGKLAEALQMLDKIGKTIQIDRRKAPLLDARYWRRRSKVQEIMGDKAGSAESFCQAFAVIEKYFDNDSDVYFSYWGILLQKLCGGKKWEALVAELAKLKTRDNDIQELSVSRRSELRGIYNWACSETGLATTELARSGQLDRAAKLLNQLASLDNNQSEIFQFWSIWSECCCQKKLPLKVSLAIKNIGKSLDLLKSSHSQDKIRVALFGYSCLASVYFNLKEPRLMHDQFKEISALVAALRPPVNPNDSILLVKTLHEIVDVKGMPIRLDEEAKPIFELAQKTATLPPQGRQPSTLDQQLADDYCWSRYRMAHWLAGHNELVRALKVLSSISPQAIARTGNPMMWRFTLTNMFAAIYWKMGDFTVARVKLKLAQSYYRKLTLAPADKENLRLKSNEMCMLINPEKPPLIEALRAEEIILTKRSAGSGARKK